eukprot:3352919-Ditylum_brightwellii.AAC.2
MMVPLEDFAQLEQRYFDGLGRFKEVGDKKSRRIYSISQNSLTLETWSFMSINHLRVMQRDNVNVKDIIDTDVRQTSAITGEMTYSLTPEDLVIRWKCGIDIARQTIKTTTQRRIRTVTNFHILLVVEI